MKKYSRQREMILQTLRSVKTHPTATRIYDMVREYIPNISLGTVYRNLSQLDEEGEILTLKAKEGSDHFDGNPEPHYHFYCEKCCSFQDLNVPVVEKLDCHLGLTDYDIRGHYLVFYGSCPACGKNARSEASPA
ncbi:MAG TPA: transcriptional repressor [Ruminococcaceae bacterium]|nr:transcriptional repressor [Oscillospiraceae bacterium]